MKERIPDDKTNILILNLENEKIARALEHYLNTAMSATRNWPVEIRTEEELSEIAEKGLIEKSEWYWPRKGTYNIIMHSYLFSFRGTVDNLRTVSTDFKAGYEAAVANLSPKKR